jgi:hypothetical protein
MGVDPEGLDELGPTDQTCYENKNWFTDVNMDRVASSSLSGLIGTGNDGSMSGGNLLAFSAEVRSYNASQSRNPSGPRSYPAYQISAAQSPARGLTVFGGGGISFATPFFGATGEIGVFLSLSTKPDAGLYLTYGGMNGLAPGAKAKAIFRGPYGVAGGTSAAQFSGRSNNVNVSTPAFGFNLHKSGDTYSGISVTTPGLPGIASSSTETNTQFSVSTLARILVNIDHEVMGPR